MVAFSLLHVTAMLTSAGCGRGSAPPTCTLVIILYIWKCVITTPKRVYFWWENGGRIRFIFQNLKILLNNIRIIQCFFEDSAQHRSIPFAK